MLFKKFMPLLAVAGLMFSNAHAFALKLGSFVISDHVQSNEEDANALLQCIENICQDNYCSAQCANTATTGELSACLSNLLAPCNT